MRTCAKWVGNDDDDFGALPRATTDAIAACGTGTYQWKQLLLLPGLAQRWNGKVSANRTTTSAANRKLDAVSAAKIRAQPEITVSSIPPTLSSSGWPPPKTKSPRQKNLQRQPKRHKNLVAGSAEFQYDFSEHQE